MTQEIYEKIKRNIEECIEPTLDNLSDPYLFENEDRVIEKIAQELCNENITKMKSCTEKETEAYRKLIGVDNNGEKRSYKEASHELNKHNVRSLVFNANRKLIWSIYKEILFEDKVKLIKINYNYQEDKGMIFPEDIEIESLKSIIYFEYEELTKIGIKNLKDITSYTIPGLTILIKEISKNSNRKKEKEKIVEELIETIHALGFLFKGEEGYEKQLIHFDNIKKEIHRKISNVSNNNELRKQLSQRKKLVNDYNNIVSGKQLIIKSENEIRKELDKTKEEIISIEDQIKQKCYNTKHR